MPVAAPAAVLLLGPTASGKSAVAMHLAERLDLEIVSVDSALVYRGLDIGTAKPTTADRSRVPHHLIDVIEPTAAYSAATFVADACRLMTEIRARGRLPLLVGGTMLYAKALIDGLDPLPAADPIVRARLDADAARLGWPALHARLQAVDPQTAARLEPGDSQRIQRALEVHELAGQPMSAMLTRRRIPADPITTELVAAGPGAYPVIALEPSDRSVLHGRIADRFGSMLAAGFLDEVAALKARGDLDPALPSMRCVGYRQAWAHLDGAGSRQEMTEQAIAATRQLAKRQLTWLRSMPARHRVDCLAADAPEQVSALAIRLAFAG